MSCAKLLTKAGIHTYVLMAALLAAGFGGRAVPALGVRRSLNHWVRELFLRRAATLLTADTSQLEPLYSTDARGQEALAHERRRAANLHDWLRLHHARLSAVRPNLRLIYLEPEGSDRVTVYVTLSTLLTYDYPAQGSAPGTIFGYTTYHVLTVERLGGAWKVAKEWYEDPLHEHLQGASHLAGLVIESLPVKEKISPQREAARAYADRYCGVFVPPHSNGRYNREYPDFTFRGGDCANFASQVLTDHAAGRIAADWSWSCDRQGATVAWARADGLVDHLLWTGRARLVAQGNLAHLLAEGSLKSLQPGDLVGYQEGGRVRHVSVITAQDSRGWPLVDSHTADRYHVPLDLGWGEHVRYWLLQTSLPI